MATDILLSSLDEHPQEECGVFAVSGLDHAAELTFLGLYALQHRGQEAAGICAIDGEEVWYHKGSGLVSEIFDAELLNTLPGSTAVGHVRYSTAGGSRAENAQPIVVQYAEGPLSVAHNGNLTNTDELRDELAANEYKLRAAANASYLSRQRYYQGVTSYLEVIENQRQEFEARLSYSENYQALLSSYISLYKSLGGGWVTEAELEKYALQLADEMNVDESEIDRDSLYYEGQLVDYYLTPEQEKERKEQRKELNRKEREMRKAARQAAK